MTIHYTQYTNMFTHLYMQTMHLWKCSQVEEYWCKTYKKNSELLRALCMCETEVAYCKNDTIKDNIFCTRDKRTGMRNIVYPNKNLSNFKLQNAELRIKWIEILMAMVHLQFTRKWLNVYRNGLFIENCRGCE